MAGHLHHGERLGSALGLQRDDGPHGGVEQGAGDPDEEHAHDDDEGAGAEPQEQERDDPQR
jgi:hypothetical protein